MIEIQSLNKTYDRRSRNANHVLRDVTLTLPDTGFICIVGASGCGKTSLLNAVGGLDTFDSGTISTRDVSVSRSGTRKYEQERNRSFSYIFQNYYLLTDHSVAYNVYLGLHSLALSHKEKLARVKEALEAVNMTRFSRRIAGELSGGQQQRVAIARALARRPRVIFADEPTGNLDEENTLNICTLLRRISKTSLVVMVTHEEHIARFFADRIITIKEGTVSGDSTGWKRENLAAGTGNTLYAEEYQTTRFRSDDISIRVLTEEGATPAALTIAVLKDRVIIKTDDSRTLSCSRISEPPVLAEGKAPIIKLEDLDDTVSHVESDAPGKAGAGLTFRMMLQEAGRLIRQKGFQRGSIRFFLMVMTVLTVWLTGDYITVSSVDPRDFIKSDSHILDLRIERGEDLDPLKYRNVMLLMPGVIDKMKAEGVDFDMIPYVTATNAGFTLNAVPQLSRISVKFQAFSYAPAERIDEETLIYGRMPENSEEIVIDRWVLEYVMKQDGILQNSLGSIQQFLGMQIDFFKKNYSPTITGICDCGNPTIYLPLSVLVSLGDRGTEIIPFSEFQSRYPGLYEGDPLKAGECIVITNNAGPVYANKVGADFRTNSNLTLKIKAAIKADTYASIVVADDSLEEFVFSMCSADYCIYAADKPAAKRIITEILDGEYGGLIQYKLRDQNGDAWKVYREAASLKADARTVITVTVIVLLMIMLYLIQRSSVQHRIGMMAVYRLLGLPNRKLAAVFTIESFMLSLESVLPAAAVTWAVVAVLNLLTDLGFHMILPCQAAAGVGLLVIAYYLLISILPVVWLLRLPPARLAAKYDL